MKISREVLSEAQLYLGSDAVRLGLVDAIGSDNDAIKKAASLAGISGYTLTDVNAKVDRLRIERNRRIIASLLTDEEQEGSISKLKALEELFPSLGAFGAGRGGTSGIGGDSGLPQFLYLVEQTSSESRALVDGFADATSSPNRKWDSFYADYEGLRAEQPTLNPSVLGARLSGLVSQFSDVARDARALPTTPSTRSIAKILVDAVEQEDLVLRKLRGIFSRTEDISGEGESISSALAFDEFDIALVNGNAQRREAAEQLADVIEGFSSENEMAVAQFSDGYDQLVSAWSAFDQQYEAWRRDEGGCDRAGATQALSQFTVQFSGLATRVRVLPRLEILQSLGEVFVEAAEREEQALRNLRTTWRPFDSEVYGSFDQERSTAGQFRRQVAAGLNELITQHDISGTELAR